jgi:signal transduction histidine kinase
VRQAEPRNNETTMRWPRFFAGILRGPDTRDATLGNEVASHIALTRGHVARKKRRLDVALALVVFGLTLGTATGFLDTGSYNDSVDPLNVTLAAVASLPLLAARRAPLAVFALTAAAIAALTWNGAPMSHGMGPNIALYFLALSPPTTRAGRWLTASTVVGFFALLAYVDRLDNAHVLEPIPALFWGGAWVLGDWVRQGRERRARLEEHARQDKREAERERRLAVAEERTRIARDLHDSAGHALNVILVQAGAARLLSERDPERARRSLETIEEVARETVGEIDQLVRVLREDGIAGRGRGASDPVPGLAALDRLIDRNRAAGLNVTVDIRGKRRILPLGVDQAAYRILQEALTNAVLHGPGSAEVEVNFGAQTLGLTVTNPTLPGKAPTSEGHGIVGMRERAALLGGRLSAEGRDELFRIEAELPYGLERP